METPFEKLAENSYDNAKKTLPFEDVSPICQMEWYFTNLDFPEIRRFPFLFATFLGPRSRLCEVAIIWPVLLKKRRFSIASHVILYCSVYAMSTIWKHMFPNGGLMRVMMI